MHNMGIPNYEHSIISEITEKNLIMQIMKRNKMEERKLLNNILWFLRREQSEESLNLIREIMGKPNLNIINTDSQEDDDNEIILGPDDIPGIDPYKITSAFVIYMYNKDLQQENVFGKIYKDYRNYVDEYLNGNINELFILNFCIKNYLALGEEGLDFADYYRSCNIEDIYNSIEAEFNNVGAIDIEASDIESIYDGESESEPEQDSQDESSMEIEDSPVNKANLNEAEIEFWEIDKIETTNMNIEDAVFSFIEKKILGDLDDSVEEDEKIREYIDSVPIYGRITLPKAYLRYLNSNTDEDFKTFFYENMEGFKILFYYLETNKIYEINNKFVRQ